MSTTSKEHFFLFEMDPICDTQLNEAIEKGHITTTRGSRSSSYGSPPSIKLQRMQVAEQMRQSRGFDPYDQTPRAKKRLFQ